MASLPLNQDTASFTARARLTIQHFIYLLVISVKLKVFYKTVAGAPWNTDHYWRE